MTQPAIYFGELPETDVFVNTKTEEFDYPRGDDNVFATYQGNGGVPLGGLFRRLMFAIRFRSTDTFFSPTLTPESRVMMHRRISERVNKIAPFLTFDPDPYLAITDGRLVWIQDAYTTSNRYPYASAAGRVNYIRNAVKVTIDAYHGTTVFHLLDPDRSDRGDDRTRVPEPLQAARRHARGPAAAPALPAGDLRHAGGHVRDLPHDEPGGLLQPRGPVGDPGVRRRRTSRAHGAVLHDHEAAG